MAEEVVVPAACLFPKPSSLSWEEAAAFPLSEDDKMMSLAFIEWAGINCGSMVPQDIYFKALGDQYVREHYKEVRAAIESDQERDRHRQERSERELSSEGE